MTYQSFKNRKIDFTKKVMVYKNLHNGLFSIKQGNLVVAHVEKLALEKVSFKVNESGRQRVITEQRKNVHAFVIGVIVSLDTSAPMQPHRAITYNPYKGNSFYYKDSSKAASLSDDELLYMDSKKGLFSI